MLDDLGLVHMNGRIYDPLLGRMLSADTFVQDAGDLQAYNRYSYVRNNPTSLNDPSGHFWSALITVGFAAYDTYNYATGKTTGAEYAKNMALNGAALVADVATAGQGGGLLVRSANAGIRVAKAVDKANDAYETVSTLVETGKVVASGDSAEISRAVVTNLVEHVVGGGKGKHDVDLNANAVSAKKLDGVDPKTAPTAEKASSRDLRGNLDDAGRPVGKDEAAHHIVAGNDKRAAESRQLLDEAGIPINHEANGVGLPKNTSSPNPDGKAVHSTAHTNEYHAGVTETLRDAAPADREAALRAIADELAKKNKK